MTQTKILLKSTFGTKEGWIYVLLFCALASPLLLLVNAVFLRLPVLNVFGEYISTVLIIIAIIGALGGILPKIKSQHIIFYVACCVVYLLQYIIFPENERWLDENSGQFFFSVLPFFVIGLLLDSKQTFRLLIGLSYAMIIYKFYYDIFYNNIIDVTIEKTNGSEAMWEAYSVMPYVIVAWWATIKRRKIVDLVFALLGTFLTLSMGNRGSILCIVTFVALYLLLFKPFKNKFWGYFIVLAITFLLIFFMEKILIGIGVVISDLDLNTRTIDKVLASEFFLHGTREDLINTITPHLKNSGFLGLGLFGTERVMGIYTHKLHYELWASFGYAIGSAILLALVVLIVKTYIKRKDIETREFLLFVCICGYMPLMFSFTFMVWPYFFLAIGYCVGRLDNIELKSLSEKSDI